MKKKVTANIIMVLVILAIAILGVVYVGHIQGWFDKQDEDSVMLTDFRGIITLERDGIAYMTTDDTILRSGDKIICDPGSTVKITVGEGYIVLGQSAKAEILEPTASEFTMNIVSGEAFVNAVSDISLSFEEKEVTMVDAVATLSVRSGAQSISVYYGNVEEAQGGEILEWVGAERNVRECSIKSLNDFNIAQLRKLNEFMILCFTTDDLDKLEAERFAQMTKPNESEEVTEQHHEDITQVTENTDNTHIESTTSETAKSPETTKTEETEKTSETLKSEEQTKPSETIKTEETTKSSEGINPQETTEIEETTTVAKEPDSTEVEPKLSCTITIRCDTILDNWDALEPAKAAYVPESGCILPVMTVEFTEGETVFDVLNRVCSTYGIQIEYSWTPMYDSYYIEGIHNLYEFDCGHESGWMYKVNGWFPNYGCSSYTLIGGEDIVWCYTCVGLGADVGDVGW